MRTVLPSAHNFAKVFGSAEGHEYDRTRNEGSVTAGRAEVATECKSFKSLS